MAPYPTPDAGDHTLSVGFILADRFTLSAFSIFIDYLRLAADEGDGSRQRRCNWEVMGAVSAPARASCGVEVSCSLRYADPTRFNYLVVVGGLLGDKPQASKECMDYLARAASAGVRLVGLCTGSFILARAGLMTGRRCCVSWFHFQDFLNEFPHHKPLADRIFIEDGDRITCSGGAGVAHLAQHLIGRHLGAPVARKSSHVLITQAAASTEEYQPHPPTIGTPRDKRVHRALFLMEQNVAEPLSLGEIADRLKLSRRQLERLFHAEFSASPAEIYLRMRLDLAHYLLCHSDRLIGDVAYEAGFPSASHFTRKFKAMFGCRPTELRRNWKQQPSQHDVQAGQRVF